MADPEHRGSVRANDCSLRLNGSMDPRAELTLHLARMVQERYAPPRSPVVWSLVPEVGSATWSEMAALLSAAPKPCLVAPLVEPGALGLWTMATMSEAGRAILTRETQYRVAYFDEKLRVCSILHSDRIRLGMGVTAYTVSVAGFLKWAAEYAIAGVAISLTKDSPGFGQILIKAPGQPPGPLRSTLILGEAPPPA